MKKIKILLFAVALSIAINLHAQESGYGLKIGLLSSNIKFSGSANPAKGKGIISPSMGVMAYAILTPKIGVYTELNLYSVIGTNHTDSVIDLLNYSQPNAKILVEDQFRVWNANWSIMATYQVIDNIFIMAGPGIDFYMSKSYKNDKAMINGFKHTYATMYMYDSDEKSLGGNISFGAGFNVSLIRFDIRYCIGLGNMYDTALVEWYPKYAGLDKASYQSIQFNLAIVIPGFSLGTTEDPLFR